MQNLTKDVGSRNTVTVSHLDRTTLDESDHFLFTCCDQVRGGVY